MISAGDFRKGITIEMDDGKIFVITDFQHVKPGKGAAFVRATIKNVVTGQTLTRTFNPNDKYENARIERRDLQYSYNDGELYYFMDTETFEQLPLNKSQVEAALPFIKEETMVSIQFYKGEAFSVDPPNFVELLVEETEPGVQGDTSKATFKPAKLETGLELQVPLFINQGEKIRVDTRNSAYMERVK
jgi:elongation factor P